MKCVIILIIYVVATSGMFNSKSIEGYPSGYLSDCPGYDREVIITERSLKYLTLTVVGEGNGYSAKRRKYSYFQMNKLIKDPNIDIRKKTLVYVGGYMDVPVYPFAVFLAPIYKKLGYNVMLLDTSHFTIMEYPLAVIYIRTAAKRVSEMLANLTDAGLDPKKLEIIGLSLGGQTMSFIAKHYKNITGQKISRLTGLDPAGPCFRNLGPDQRLDQSDADFVDVVSTNIDWYGMAAPMGHVNFYVNGGEYQPGDILFIPCNILCSHIRSYTIWLAALQNPNSFIAIKCDTIQDARNKDCYDRLPKETNVLGLNTDKNKTGVYFLATHNNFPYYMGQKGLQKSNEFFSARLKGIVNSDSMVL